jgi:hypothetical protein
MVEIKIPFKKEFKDAILSGVKDTTSRNKRYGIPGDTFEIFGKKFELIVVKNVQLSYVRAYYWKREGAKSMDDFVRIWIEIHPRKGYVAQQYVWLHTWKDYDGVED